MAEIRQIDRRWIFLCVAVALIVAMLFPFSQPISPSPSVRAVYDFIEELPPGSSVLIATDYDPQARAEVVPITDAILTHLFRHHLRVIGMTFWPEGASLGNRLFEQAGQSLGKERGADFVYLGYKPGPISQIITNMGEDIRSAFPRDANNQPTAGMPIFRNVSSLRDVCYIIDIAAGSTVDAWIVYGGDKYHIPMAAGCTAVVGPDLYVYTNTGQLTGIVAGLRGAADYEVLLGSPGSGVRGMPAQSVVHAIIVLFVLAGNVAYFVRRRRAGNG